MISGTEFRSFWRKKKSISTENGCHALYQQACKLRTEDTARRSIFDSTFLQGSDSPMIDEWMKNEEAHNQTITFFSIQHHKLLPFASRI